MEQDQADVVYHYLGKALLEDWGPIDDARAPLEWNHTSSHGLAAWCRWLHSMGKTDELEPLFLEFAPRARFETTVYERPVGDMRAPKMFVQTSALLAPPAPLATGCGAGRSAGYGAGGAGYGVAGGGAGGAGGAGRVVSRAGSRGTGWWRGGRSSGGGVAHYI